MKIQQFDPRIISITQVRRDINVLGQVLEQENEAWVMKNQSLMFVAISPKKYQDLQASGKKNLSINKAIKSIAKIRKEFYGQKKTSVSEYVSKMRDERAKKWKK